MKAERPACLCNMEDGGCMCDELNLLFEEIEEDSVVEESYCVTPERLEVSSGIDLHSNEQYLNLKIFAPEDEDHADRADEECWMILSFTEEATQQLLTDGLVLASEMWGKEEDEDEE